MSLASQISLLAAAVGVQIKSVRTSLALATSPYAQMNQQGQLDIHNAGLKAKMQLDAGTEVLVDWSTLTGIGSNGVAVSGNTLKSTGAASPNAAMIPFAVADGQCATASCVLVLAQTGQTIMFGVAGGTQGSAPLAASANAFMIGIRTTQFAGGVIGSSIGGSGQFDIGTAALPNGRYIATVVVDEVQISLSLRAEANNGTEFVYRLNRTRMAAVGGINNLICYNGGATNTIEPVSGIIGAQTLRTKVIAAKTVVATSRVSYMADSATGYPTGGGTDRWRIDVPPSYDPATPKPMILWLHNSGGDALNASTDSRIWPLLNAFRTAGYIVASADAGGSQWGNDMQRGMYRELYKYVRDRYAISGVYLAGCSMGGATAWQLLTRNEIPNVLAFLGVAAVASLADLYAHSYSAQINAAFGVTALASVPARFKPEGLAGSAFSPVPIMLVNSPGDTTVTYATATALVAKILAANPGADMTVKSSTNDHMDAQQFLDAVTYGIPFLASHPPAVTTL